MTCFFLAYSSPSPQQVSVMATPKEYLPPALSESIICSLLEELNLPPPTSISPLQVTAAFHSIYLINYPLSATPLLAPAKTPNEDGKTISLVLRVSGNHIPHAKTRNEVAIMKWISQNTSIPIPAIVRWDDTSSNQKLNALGGYEFTILERVQGQSVDKVYDTLSEDKKKNLVSQLIDILLDLHSHSWQHIGGLQIVDSFKNKLNDSDQDHIFAPGPTLEDTYWQVPDIEKYWGGKETKETVQTLNPWGPFENHTELIKAWLHVFIHSIKTHASLKWLEEKLLPKRFQSLIEKLPSLPELDQTRLLLAHKDLHFANVMVDPKDGKITAILDWEFATIVPALRWDPVRAFLWNGQENDDATKEKTRLYSLFLNELKRRKVENWWESSEQVDHIWTVIRFTRALIEVCPRGQRADLIGNWAINVQNALTKLGV